MNIKLYGDGIHDDTAAIQTMLDKCGTVRIPEGYYLISRPLIIHSNTHLILDRNATLHLADGANCSLLDNDGLYRDETNENVIIEGGIWDGNHMAQERKPIPNECRPGDENEDKPCDKQIDPYPKFAGEGPDLQESNELCYPYCGQSIFQRRKYRA